ncbi:hypothetical protein H5410_056506 [Solanum commersonii]|uniref:Uncharacterized protein n=1 Tax=Solanum commersonii TaxID=4109 RepID=A0A9J5WMG1_SOLCO|nr:hypothetical protein H5410_056506 [Solanum commersonii]
MDHLVIHIFDVNFAKNIYGRLSRPYLWRRFVQTGKSSLFHGQMIPREGKSPAIESVGPDGDTYPFPWSNDPQSGEIPNFRSHFCKKILWTSIKTLVMELVGLDGQTGLFLRSNEPRSRETPLFCQFSCAIVHGSFGDPDFLCHFCQNISWAFVKTLAMDSVCPDG